MPFNRFRLKAGLHTLMCGAFEKLNAEIAPWTTFGMRPAMLSPSPSQLDIAFFFNRTFGIQASLDLKTDAG